ncbi:MAG: hypothetical protein AB7F09_15175 [Parvibaculaceae bacterium]
MPTQKRAVAYAAATLLALTLASSGAEAYQCKAGLTQAEAIGNPKFKARASAKAIWSTTVKNKYGVQWSVWNIAASKGQRCNWTGAKWYCIVKARPCLYVVP